MVQHWALKYDFPLAKSEVAELQVAELQVAEVHLAELIEPQFAELQQASDNAPPSNKAANRIVYVQITKTPFLVVW